MKTLTIIFDECIVCINLNKPYTINSYGTDLSIYVDKKEVILHYVCNQDKVKIKNCIKDCAKYVGEMHVVLEL